MERTRDEIQAQIDILTEYDLDNFCEGLVEELEEQLQSAKSIEDLQREAFNAARCKNEQLIYTNCDNCPSLISTKEDAELFNKNSERIAIYSLIDNNTKEITDKYYFCRTTKRYPKQPCNINHNKIGNKYNTSEDYLNSIQND